jgi:endonuclease/exonuclease/phosphatase family metal-dependent hydrolase
MPWQKHWKTGHQLTVVTYNTNGMLVDKKLEDKLAMLDYVKKLDADIVCLQEVLVYKNPNRFTLPDLREAMREYPYTYYDFKVYNSRRQFGNVVFSRYPLINKQTIRYESQSNISSQCDVVVGQDTLRLVVNHLESFRLNNSDFSLDSLTANTLRESSLNRKLTYASRLRRQQAYSVRKAIHHSPYPVIAVGDFNAIPLSAVYWIMNTGLRDCYAESSVGRYGSTYERKGIRVRIDYIFTSRALKPLACRVGKERYSDHYPVIATIGW